MGNFNSEDFEEVGKTIKPYLAPLINFVLDFAVILNTMYMDTIDPIFVRFLYPYIYGNMRQIYPDVDNAALNIRYNDNNDINNTNITDYFNLVVLPHIRKNYGKSNIETVQELLMNYYIHNNMFEELDNISNISHITFMRSLQSGKMLVSAVLNDKIDFR